MSADLNTWITLKGTTEELAAMLKVLKKFENDNAARYAAKGDCAYIELVEVHGNNGIRRLENISDDEIPEFVSSAGRKLRIEASGPLGTLWPRDAGLFEALADAASTAYFNGSIYGSVSGEEIGHGGDLIDGKLYLIDYTENDDEDFDDEDDAADDVEYRVYNPETHRYSEGRFVKKCPGLNFVIVGDVIEFKNTESLTDYIEKHGGRVAEKVSEQTNYLISNAPASVLPKNKKAVSRGMIIITEAEFIAKFGQ